jgi:7-keto-8-aminopelargonate synthetase-like enzyme
LADEVDFFMVTFGKSAGAAGGCVAANGEWIELVSNKARSFIYSTAPPAGQAASACEGLRIIASAEGDTLREQLSANTRTLSEALRRPTPPAAIFPIEIGEEAKALSVAAGLQTEGFLVPAIRYPTVARGSARLRVTLSAAHRQGDIDRLATHLLGLD